MSAAGCVASPFPVVVVSAGGFQGLAVVAAAAAVPGVRVVVADSLADPVTASLADEVVRVPPLADEEGFATAVAALFARLGPGLLLPATARELPVLARRRTQLEGAGARVAAMSAPTLERLGDRARLAEELDRLKIPAPPLVSAATAALPLLAKPRRGWGGRGQVTIDDEAQRLAFLARSDGEDFVVEPLHRHFREYTVDFAVGFRGEVSPLLARRRLRNTGGFCVVAESSEDEALLAPAAAVAAHLAALGEAGIASLQLLDPGSGPYVSDLNLRAGTSSSLARERGVNLVEHLVRSARDQPPLPVTPSRGRRQWRLLEDRSRPAAALAVRAVVLDLDDTLLDHKLWVWQKLELVGQRFAAALRDPGDFVLAAWSAFEEGERSRTLDVALAQLALPAELRGPLIEAYREAVPAEPALYADVAGALAALRDAGLLLVLATDNPPASQRQKLDASGLGEAFDEVVFTREAGGEKPSALAVEAALARLGVRPDGAAMVGDNPLRDGRAALAAGMAHFFWLQREGAIFAVHPRIVAGRLPALAAMTTPVRSLREVVDALLRP